MSWACAWRTSKRRALVDPEDGAQAHRHLSQRSECTDVALGDIEPFAQLLIEIEPQGVIGVGIADECRRTRRQPARVRRIACERLPEERPSHIGLIVAPSPTGAASLNADQA